LKPDVSAIDGVSVTGAGGFGSPFFGTSAATPHAAGVAALLLQSAPCLLTGSSGARDSATARSSLHSLILNNAVDLGVAGPDEVFGYGRIDALASARQALPSASGATSSVLVNGNSASGASVTAAQIGFIDPDSCPLSLTFSGGCGSGSGAAMNCPFGTSSVSVSATNNGITMSSPAKLQITVTSFAVSAAVASPGSNAVTAGQPATYTVTVAPQIGSFTSPVNLICSNLPAFSSCAFNSSSVVPGQNPVSTSLRISTTARASLPGPLGRFLDGVPAPGQLQVRFVALLLILEAAGAVLAWLVRARRPLLLFAVLTLVLAVVTVACGGTSGSSPASGTPAGMYQISVTGTSGSLAQSATVSLTVQ
jgi:hypothetical protein